MTAQEREGEALDDLKVLPPRELETLVLAAKGFNGTDQAKLLGRSVHSINELRARATRRLNVNMYGACALLGKAGLA